MIAPNSLWNVCVLPLDCMGLALSSFNSTCKVAPHKRCLIVSRPYHLLITYTQSVKLDGAGCVGRYHTTTAKACAYKHRASTATLNNIAVLLRSPTAAHVLHMSNVDSFYRHYLLRPMYFLAVNTLEKTKPDAL